MGKVVYPDCHAESIGRWTHDRITSRSHLSCRISDRYDVASWISVARAGSEALQRLRALQERCRNRVGIVAAFGIVTGALQGQDLGALQRL